MTKMTMPPPPPRMPTPFDRDAGAKWEPDPRAARGKRQPNISLDGRTFFKRHCPKSDQLISKLLAGVGEKVNGTVLDLQTALPTEVVRLAMTAHDQGVENAFGRYQEEMDQLRVKAAYMTLVQAENERLTREVMLLQSALGDDNRPFGDAPVPSELLLDDVRDEFSSPDTTLIDALLEDEPPVLSDELNVPADPTDDHTTVLGAAKCAWPTASITRDDAIDLDELVSLLDAAA
jgi:hypothetical protein